jgi:hypothetical protein
MNPYRELFVVDDSQQDDAHELRGFTILLIVLGRGRQVIIATPRAPQQGAEGAGTSSRKR